jgi:hypothetical protein
MAGKQGRCPACGRVLDIPGAASPGPETAQYWADFFGVPLDPPPTEAVADRPQSLPLSPDGVRSPDGDEWSELRRLPFKLYSPGQVAGVTFLLGPVGGFLLMALNYHRLGKGLAAGATLVVGFVTIVALLALAFAMPDSFPTVLLGLPVFLVLWVAAKVLQGGAYDAHLRVGGEKASTLAAVGIGVLGLALHLGFTFGAAFLLEGEWGLGEKIDYGGGEEVYYSGGVTRDEASRVGSVLRRAGYFDGQGGKTVVLRREGNRLVVSFVVLAWAVDAPQAQQEMRAIQSLIRQELGGRPVEVRLCDENLRVKRTLP